MGYCVYILHSEKLARYYIGFTSNLISRLEFHASAESRKFTYNADDWSVFVTINCESRSQALSIEKHIKKMKSKKYIENIKRYPEISQKLLDRYVD